ncbi:MAG: ABC transporter permease [Gammaproteobacteria bacterium]|jgi:ABC-2 type transport system permease protein
MWNRIGALIIKEFLATLRDKRARVVLIGPPLVQMFIFSFAATLEVKNVNLAIFNEDNGKAAHELVQRFRGSRTFSHIRLLHTTRQIRQVIDARKALAVVHIPQDFSKKLYAGQSPEVQIILDGRSSNTAQIVQGYLSRIVDGFNHDVGALRGAPPPQSELVTRHWFNPNLEYTWYTVPSLVGLLTMIIGVVITALSVARERELGTFDQLLVSPLTPFEILIGKTVPSLLIAGTDGTLILLIGIFAFRIPFNGSLVSLYVSMFFFLAAIIGIGLFISSLARTQQQAFLGTFTFAVPAVLLSGFATPIDNMPDWLQPVTLLDPLRHFMTVVRGIFLKALPPDFVFANTWPMAAIAAVTLTAAALLFNRRLE